MGPVQTSAVGDQIFDFLTTKCCVYLVYLNIQQLIYFVSYIFRAEVPHEYQVAPGSLTLLPTEHMQASLANGILYTQHTPSILLFSY